MQQETVEALLIARTQELLDAIARSDYQTYEAYTHPTLTCFEPEARGQLVHGIAFHRTYFQPPHHEVPAPAVQTICNPHVRLLSQDAAVVSYVRLQQRRGVDGSFSTAASEETRVWQKDADGEWRNLHFHRSSCS